MALLQRHCTLRQYFCNEVSDGVMSEDDIATFLASQTMVDGIVLTSASGRRILVIRARMI